MRRETMSVSVGFKTRLLCALKVDFINILSLALSVSHLTAGAMIVSLHVDLNSIKVRKYS